MQARQPGGGQGGRSRVEWPSRADAPRNVNSATARSSRSSIASPMSRRITAAVR